ncbi:MAG TPA: fibronectin type III domain-containing protein [Terracidiphilus sp.]
MSSGPQRVMALPVACVLLAAAMGLAGCGTPGAPQPPSLNLPDRVADLRAVRTGSQVALTWTMPKRTTDRVTLKDDIAAEVCWRIGSGGCVPVGARSFAPAVEASFLVALPDALAARPPQPLSYYVELKNRAGKSAGLSNEAVVLGGRAPAPVTGLQAEVRKQGIVLRWNAIDPADSIRLKRTLLNPPATTPKQGPLAPAAESVSLDLLVEHDGGVALDKGVTFGRDYEYRAQRIAPVTSEGKTMELPGEISAPLRVTAQDVFPPAVPADLAAVAIGAANGNPASIDLSWQPTAENDVAGYRVYRREGTEWRRISGDQPLVGPALHDADVQPGHTYVYAVTAVDTRGNESPRSTEASDTVPQP